VQLLRGLRDLGHETTLWLEDDEGRHARASPANTRRSFEDFFASDGIPLHTDFGGWRGADVVLATGWQTVWRALLLPGAGARAYLVQDHEPEFYPASAESLWAEQSYGQGLHCIAASPWLASLIAARYGASASHFDLAVDHDVYRPSRATRRENLVVFYARATTPRRAVPLGVLALSELARRHPKIEIALYGEAGSADVAFAHRDLGLLSDRELAQLYGVATVGMVLSLTNPSLAGLQMMACGLPCVEAASGPMLATFGKEGPLALAPLEPLALCEAIEALLEDSARRETAAERGRELIGERTWKRATEQLESGLRMAMQRAGT
jgi:glycosyltransferase involved in cell wall biosynthesis